MWFGREVVAGRSALIERAWVVALVLVLFALGSPDLLAQQEEGGPQAPISTVSDARLDRQIEHRLGNIFVNLEGLQNIEVHADAGVVTLAGEVFSREEEQQALELAGRTEGVVSVVNELRYNRSIERQVGQVVPALRERMQAIVLYLPILLTAVLVFLAFWLLARWMTRDRAYFDRFAPNVFIADLVKQLVRGAIIVLGLVVSLQIADATSVLGSLLGALGLAGLAFGFAIRETVENYIASILLSLRQPFSPNDHVLIEGHEGLVLRLTSRATLLMSFDGNHIRIPNAIVYKGIIVNYTRNPQRRIAFELGVGAEVNLVSALQLADQVMSETPGVLAEPAPTGVLQAVGDSNVVLAFYAWMDQAVSDYTTVRSETIRRVKLAFQQASFDMPEPTYRINLQGEDAKQPPVAPIQHDVPGPSEPIQHSPERQQSPEDAVRAQLAVDREREEDHDDLLSEHAPKE